MTAPPHLMITIYDPKRQILTTDLSLGFNKSMKLFNDIDLFHHYVLTSSNNKLFIVIPYDTAAELIDEFHVLRYIKYFYVFCDDLNLYDGSLHRFRKLRDVFQITELQSSQLVHDITVDSAKEAMRYQRLNLNTLALEKLQHVKTFLLKGFCSNENNGL
ncbi:unnamed protein product [Didymodactylos carnosus]|uniref:Uncharacterized protein n=1 Tax=Didymodactylos carnosus TaxID=1234261 RepID=A0A815HHP3_9BILA|nr:unnamed protein product [Didymodactylos carnosus]CAF1423650.1 unnamed protein product [Didymodactylos carnosus]CAF4220777.1 unnamed protein product [Didymodactylos carnosus]CAF4223532.1 unnamed protein product [Didymodactylos carnosus]